MSRFEAIETDVLIVGGGGAGCRAAIEAHDQGADVLMIVKGRVGHSGCTLNVGTSAAVGPWGHAEDTNIASMYDLLAHGGFLGDQDLARVLVEESKDRVLEMQEWGTDFERDGNGAIAVDRSAAHTYPRNLRFKPRSRRPHDYGSPPGIAIMDALMAQMEKRNIRVMDEVALVDLLKAEGRVVGATAIDCRRNAPVVFNAKSTVVATGTYSQVFANTTVSVHETGDGHAAAYRAGAELVDMENTQFVATSTGYRPGSVFLNARGETFLEKYGITSLEGVDKEALCYAVWKEIREGRGTSRDTIFVNMVDVFQDEETRASYLPRLLENLKTRQAARHGSQGDEALDPTREPVETAPLAHTTTGGVRINPECESSVPGLWAAGAAAGGVYGHARPEGYTSMITLVFGRRAGLFAAQSAKYMGLIEPDDGDVQIRLDWASDLVEKAGGIRPADTRAQIQALMGKHAWVIKDEEGLTEGLRLIDEVEEIGRLAAAQSTFKARPQDGYQWLAALETANLLICAKMMLAGALMRRESRGAFFRDDYPQSDNDNWLKNIVSRQADGRLVLDETPVALKYCGPDRRPTSTLF